MILRRPCRKRWILLSTALVLLCAMKVAAAEGVDRLASMTLEEKVGQLFMIHAYGAGVFERRSENLDVTGVHTIEEAIRRYRPGGIIYFNWTDNIRTPEQIAKLSSDIQRIAADVAPSIPLLIAIDQEHGAVRRIGPPATEFPGNMALAAAGDPELAARQAEVTGLELSAMGINVNFAPVADVNVNPRNPVIGARSFGDRPDIVSEFVAAQVRGFRSAGIASAAKHFPGHGDTDVDSHSGLPIIEHTDAELRAVDLPPFAAAIRAGVDLIMTAHIVVPALDPDLPPATMSRPILTGLLRDELGFDGVIVTDALNMAGARQTFDPERVPVEALKAGADLLLMPPDVEVAFEAVLAAVRSGEISEARIDASVRRILALKERLGLLYDDAAPSPPGLDILGAPPHAALARQIAERSLTVLRDQADLLPVDWRGKRVLVTGWGESQTELLASLIADRGARVMALAVGASPSEAAIRGASSAARDADIVVLLTMNAPQNRPQLDLASSLAGVGKPVVGVALGMPYDAGSATDIETYVATYGFRDVSIEALDRLLSGEVRAQGRLPVSVD